MEPPKLYAVAIRHTDTQPYLYACCHAVTDADGYPYHNAEQHSLDIAYSDTVRIVLIDAHGDPVRGLHPSDSGTPDPDAPPDVPPSRAGHRNRDPLPNSDPDPEADASSDRVTYSDPASSG